MASVISGAILRTQSDERLVALARGGHQRAFEAIVERYRAELMRSLRRVLPSGSVEDALQQTHLQAWKALAEGTEVRELRAWLHRIARTAAIGVASRGYDFDELHDALLVTPGPELDLERREAVRRALRGIAELPERQREALLAVAVGGRSHAEVALDLGITDTAARQLVRRARVSLLALASVVTPPQLVHWAARAGGTVAAGKAAAGTGIGGSLAGSALKAGAVAVTVGGVAAGVAPIHQALAPPPRAPHHRQAHRARPSVDLTAALPAAAVLRPARLIRAPAPAARPAPAPGPGPAEARHRARRHPPPTVDTTVGTAPATPGPSAAAPAPVPAPVAVPAVAPAVAAAANAGALAALAAWWYAHQAARASTPTAGVATPAPSPRPPEGGPAQATATGTAGDGCAGASAPAVAGGPDASRSSGAAVAGSNGCGSRSASPGSAFAGSRGWRAGD